MHYDARDGLQILVVTVAASRPGDPMFTLYKQLQVISRGGKQKKYLRATVFVRYPGRTEVARLKDIRALLERHVAPFREADALASDSVEIARSSSWTCILT
jgi:hypothetical protein